MNDSKFRTSKGTLTSTGSGYLTWQCLAAQMLLLLREPPPLRLTDTGQTPPVASPSLRNTHTPQSRVL